MSTPRDMSAGTEVLVTGAGGFIGSAVVSLLNARGARVRAVLGPPGAPIIEPPPGVLPIRSDIRDLTLLVKVLQGVSVVVHLAGPASVRQSFEMPAEYAATHVVGTATLLEAARRAGVSRVVHVSSAEVYGRSARQPVSEDHPLAVRSPYAAAKAAAEQFVEAFVRSYGLNGVILRPFSIYGPGLSSQSLIGSILEQARRSDGIWLSDLSPIRDYCYVADLADAVVKACHHQSNWSVVNIGSGIGTSVSDLAGSILRIVGRSIPVRETPLRQRSKNAEIPCLVCDPRRAFEVFGWRPETSLESGLEKTIRWLDESKAS
jgi:nucleoside-diphosphate-sugar epimerase